MTSILAQQPVIMVSHDLAAHQMAIPRDLGIQAPVLDPAITTDHPVRAYPGGELDDASRPLDTEMEEAAPGGRESTDEDGPLKKRRKSRKGLDRKFECPQDGCGKSYSRAEHL